MLSTFGVVTEAILKQLVKKKWYWSFCYFFGHHKTPSWPPRYSSGLCKGSQRCPTSQATLTTAQKNLLAQKSRFDLIWNRSASHKWWEAVFSSWDQMSLFLGYISRRKRAFAFIFFAKVIWGHERNWAMHRSLFGATLIWSPTDIALIPWSCTLSYILFHIRTRYLNLSLGKR